MPLCWGTVPRATPLTFQPVYPTHTLSLVVWSGVFASPLFYWGAIVPCVRCHDFVATMAHETGHLLGLGHPDAPPPRMTNRL